MEKEEILSEVTEQNITALLGIILSVCTTEQLFIINEKLKALREAQDKIE